MPASSKRLPAHDEASVVRVHATDRAKDAMKRIIFAAVLVTLALAPWNVARAQPRAFAGEVPQPGSIGLVAPLGAFTTFEIEKVLAANGCVPETLAVLVSGSWSVYISGAPQAVNAAFPALLPELTPLFVRCSPAAPPATAPGTPAAPGPDAFPQPGSPVGLSIRWTATPVSAEVIRMQITVDGVPPDSFADVLRSVRLCRFAVGGPYCEDHAPPPGTTPQGGDLFASYSLEVPEWDEHVFYMAQLCNANGCTDYEWLGTALRSSYVFADFYVVATAHTGYTITQIFMIDPVFRRFEIHYSDGLSRQVLCQASGECNDFVLDETDAPIVSVIPHLLDGWDLPEVSLGIRPLTGN